MIKILIYDTDKKIVAFAQEDNALNAKEFLTNYISLQTKIN